MIKKGGYMSCILCRDTKNLPKDIDRVEYECSCGQRFTRNKDMVWVKDGEGSWVSHLGVGVPKRFKKAGVP